MIPAAFGYTRAGSVDEALRILAADGDAKVIAGGQSLLPLMKLRLASPSTLVDIGRLTELRGVRRLDDGRLQVGALTTYADLLDSAAEHYGVLRDALPDIGDVQVRNRGTVGGSVAHADPARTCRPRSSRSTRSSCSSRRAGPGRSRPTASSRGRSRPASRHDELLTDVILPGPRDGSGSAYVALEQPASGYAMVGVAVGIVVGRGRRHRVRGRRHHRCRRPSVPGVGRRGRPRRRDRLGGVDRGRGGPRGRRRHGQLGHPRERRVPDRHGGRDRPARDRGGARARRLTLRLAAPSGAARSDRSGSHPAGRPRRRRAHARPARGRRALGEGPAAVGRPTWRRSRRRPRGARRRR